MLPEEMFVGGMGRGDLWPTVRRILRERKRWMLLIFLAVAVPAVWMAAREDPRFKSSAIILMEQSADDYPVFREWVPRNSLPILMTLLKSRSVAEEVVESLPKASFEELLTHRDQRDYGSGLVNMYRRLQGAPNVEASPKQLVVRELQQARVQFISRGAGLVEVEAWASSPQVAVDVVGAYVEVVQNRARAMNREQARAFREFMETTLGNVAGTLKQAEQALADFRKQRGFFQPDPNAQIDLLRLAQREEALAEVEISEKAAQARLAMVRAALAREPQEAAKPKPGPAEPEPFSLKVLQTRLQRLEKRYTDLLDRYTEDHPLVKAAQAEMAEVRAMLEPLQRRQMAEEAADPQRAVNRQELAQQGASLAAELKALQARRQTLQVQVGVAKAKVANVSQDELEFSRLKRAYDAQQSMFAMLTEKIQHANARASGELRSVRVIEPPVFPLGFAYARSVKIALLGVLLGVLLGLGGAVGFEFLNDAVRTEPEMEALLGVPVLGSISRMVVPKALPAAKGQLRLAGGGGS